VWGEEEKNCRGWRRVSPGHYVTLRGGGRKRMMRDKRRKGMTEEKK